MHALRLAARHPGTKQATSTILKLTSRRSLPPVIRFWLRGRQSPFLPDLAIFIRNPEKNRLRLFRQLPRLVTFERKTCKRSNN